MGRRSRITKVMAAYMALVTGKIIAPRARVKMSSSSITVA